MKLKISSVLVLLCGLLSGGMSFSQPADEKNSTAENHYFSENFKAPDPADAIEIYYYFDVKEDQGTSHDEAIKLSSDVPEGLNYRIQVAAFHNSVSNELWNAATWIR